MVRCTATLMPNSIGVHVILRHVHVYLLVCALPTSAWQCSHHCPSLQSLHACPTATGGPSCSCCKLPTSVESCRHHLQCWHHWQRPMWEKECIAAVCVQERDASTRWWTYMTAMLWYAKAHKKGTPSPWIWYWPYSVCFAFFNFGIIITNKD